MEYLPVLFLLFCSQIRYSFLAPVTFVSYWFESGWQPDSVLENGGRSSKLAALLSFGGGLPLGLRLSQRGRGASLTIKGLGKFYTTLVSASSLPCLSLADGAVSEFSCMPFPVLALALCKVRVRSLHWICLEVEVFSQYDARSITWRKETIPAERWLRARNVFKSRLIGSQIEKENCLSRKVRCRVQRLCQICQFLIRQSPNKARNSEERVLHY